MPNTISIEASDREADHGTTGYQLQAVYEFRPLPNMFRGEVRRFSDGKWLPDDGEYDLAFIGRAAEWGAPICLYFHPSYQRNIIGSWVTSHWSAHERRHRDGNAWHYALRPGQTKWGGNWGRENHANTRAGESGMNLMSSECGCCNGSHVAPTDMKDAHILAGRVRDRSTKAMLVLPNAPRCMYCGEIYAAEIARQASDRGGERG
jgi:hypothetical protein